MSKLHKNSTSGERDEKVSQYRDVSEKKKEERKIISQISNIGKNIVKIIPYKYGQINVYAFVGASGTGKSFNAQEVAFKHGIEAIIDDGLLIKGNRVVGGSSAKAAKTKIDTIRKALFNSEEEQSQIRSAIKREKIKSILILGTSDQMVKRIQENLRLPDISKTIYIDEVSSKEEQKEAIKIRKEQGKHIVPVPSFEIKKDFSGIFLSQFKKKRKLNIGRGARSIIRPTFSYFGTYTIKDTVFRGIVKKIASDIEEVESVHKIEIYKEKSAAGEYLELDLNIVVYYGHNVVDVIKKFTNMLREALEKTTSIHNIIIDIKVANIRVDKEYSKEFDSLKDGKRSIKRSDQSVENMKSKAKSNSKKKGGYSDEPRSSEVLSKT